MTHRIAIVTGTSSGVGAATARALVDRGWTVVGAARRAAAIDHPNYTHVTIDLADVRALPAAFERAVAPVWLMGFIARRASRDTVLRIVNVSTGAAVTAFPGLAAYASSKAALRMAGQVVAAELDSPVRQAPGPADTAILSYQPGTVDTPMQTSARSIDPAEFPWAQMFRDFHARGLLVDPSVPAAEIVAFLESDSAPRLTERRLGAS